MPGAQSHRRVKDIDYDDDDVYSEEDEQDYDAGADGLTAEDKEQFATLTPVVRAELDEASLEASDKEIQDALWNYYWDVGKSVTYLKNSKQPKTQNAAKSTAPKKAKSKFDEAAEASAKKAGDRCPPLDISVPTGGWFMGVPWSGVPQDLLGDIRPTQQARLMPKLLGGSSKLAKLAEERKRKKAAAEAARQDPQETVGQAEAEERVTNRLEQLAISRPEKRRKESEPTEQRRYTAKKKERTPSPQRLPEPQPDLDTEPKEQLPDLRAPPTDFGRTISKSPGYGSLDSRMQLQDLLGNSRGSDAFQDPSPDDLVRHAQSSSRTSDTSKPHNNKGTTGLEKKTEELKLAPAPAVQQLAPRKAKSKMIDVPAVWAASREQRKPSAAFVVIGHIDHGKSTLMGRLLLDTGAVQQRDIDKYQKQAAEMGKESFALAWVMDSTEDERANGVTIDIAQHHFSTEKADFTILDAPGHRDFVPNMIAGASMADLGVLVVDANQLESGLKGQTKEHMVLAKAIGLKRMIVAVNKMDTTIPAWDQVVFESVKGEVLELLLEIGLASDDIKFVPCAGLTGDNVAKVLPMDGPTSWVAEQSGSLIAALEKSASATKTPVGLVKQPFRLRINDVLATGGSKTPDSVAGRINSGNVQAGDTIVLQPCGEQAEVKRIEVSDETVDYAVAGQIATLQLIAKTPEILDENVRKGDVASSASDVVAVVTDFTARFTAVDSLWPRPMEVHIGPLKKGGSVANPIIAKLDKDDEVVKKKPKVVLPGQFARIKVEVPEGLALDVDTAVVLRGTEGLLGYCVVESLGARKEATAGS